MGAEMSDSRPALAWRKSRASADTDNCVEVASTAATVLVRDSKNPAGGHLTVNPGEWRELLRRIRRGES